MLKFSIGIVKLHRCWTALAVKSCKCLKLEKRSYEVPREKVAIDFDDTITEDLKFIRSSNAELKQN